MSGSKRATVSGRTVWNKKPGTSSFSGLRMPENADQVARQIADAAKTEADARVKAYETPVTAETLRTPAQ